MISVTVTKQGPLFDGRLARSIADAVDDAEQTIARMGADHLKDDLGVPPFKHPTGWYRSHITEKRVGSLWRITDSGVIYGPWLAGTGSRNASSRFKGYAHWRRLLQYVNTIAKPTTEKIVQRYLRRLGL